MANDGTAPTSGNDSNHRKTYSAFLGVTKWAIGFIVVVLVLMALFLVH